MSVVVGIGTCLCVAECQLDAYVVGRPHCVERKQVQIAHTNTDMGINMQRNSFVRHELAIVGSHSIVVIMSPN